MLGEEGPGGGAGVPVDEYGDMLPSLEMAAPPGAEKARAAGEVAESGFPLPAGGGSRLIESAVARKDEDLNGRRHRKHKMVGAHTTLLSSVIRKAVDNGVALPRATGMTEVNNRGKELAVYVRWCCSPVMLISKASLGFSKAEERPSWRCWRCWTCWTCWTCMLYYFGGRGSRAAGLWLVHPSAIHNCTSLCILLVQTARRTRDSSALLKADMRSVGSSICRTLCIS